MFTVASLLLISCVARECDELVAGGAVDAGQCTLLVAKAARLQPRHW